MYKYYYDAREMGRRIKEVRRRCRMTQEQLAEHLILTAESVSNTEKGKTVCMPEHVIRICELFEVTADHLYFGGEVWEPEKYTDRMCAIGAMLEKCSDSQLKKIEKVIEVLVLE